MIVVTGAAGFIASYLAEALNAAGQHNLILVDDFSSAAKKPNWVHLAFEQCIDREAFLPWFEENAAGIEFVFHLGARTDTTEKSQEVLDHLNLHFSQTIWNICAAQQIPLVYASSAATYGLGEFGYKDDHALSSQLQPLNLYGKSKNDFDIDLNKSWLIGDKISDIQTALNVNIKNNILILDSSINKSDKNIASMTANSLFDTINIIKE